MSPTSPSPGPTSLANTGVDITRWVFAGVVLLIVGAAFAFGRKNGHHA